MAASTNKSRVLLKVVDAWMCPECDVEGRSPAGDAACWNCGGEVVVTARPSVPR